MQPKSLVEIMQKLRAPDGCPWDREQNHESLKPYMVEECYECLDAIDSGDDAELKSELGDVLLQVVFHAQVAAERGAFDFCDVEKTICEKMIRRHPHVFGDSEISTVQEVKEQWNKIKDEEKVIETAETKSLCDGLPSGLPALQKALKVQSRASKRGFEWASVDGALEKLREEIGELQDAVKKKDRSEIESEFGDVFFALLKVSRFLNLDAEASLNKTISKFTNRFSEMEQALKADGLSVEESSLEELTQYWNHAKKKDE